MESWCRWSPTMTSSVLWPVVERQSSCSINSHSPTRPTNNLQVIWFFSWDTWILCPRIDISTTSLRPTMSDALATLHWLRLPQRVDFKMAVMAFRVLHGLVPPYLNQLARVADLPRRRWLPSASSLAPTARATIPANNRRSTDISSRCITPMELIAIRHPSILFSICPSSTS